MASDPELNAALAAHGYTKNATGEILAARRVRGRRSARATRRSPGTWTATNGNGPPRTPAKRPGRRCAAPGMPGRGPRAARTRSPPRPGDGPRRTVADRAAALGYRAPTGRSTLTPTPVGALDRDELVEPGAGPAGRRPLGVEPRRRARRGGAADRRRRRRRRRRRCASSWPRTSPPAPWPRACRCWTATACPSTSGPGPPRRCSTVEADLTARLAARAAGPLAGP